METPLTVQATVLATAMASGLTVVLRQFITVQKDKASALFFAVALVSTIIVAVQQHMIFSLSNWDALLQSLQQVLGTSWVVWQAVKRIPVK